jgi:hypothetical protein
MRAGERAKRKRKPNMAFYNGINSTQTFMAHSPAHGPLSQHNYSSNQISACIWKGTNIKTIACCIDCITSPILLRVECFFILLLFFNID